MARRGYIRVTIPLAGFNLSGGVKSLIGLANGLVARGHSVRIVVPDFAASPPAPLQPGVQVRTLGTGPAWIPLSVRQVAYLVRLATVATAGCDICLANYFTTAYAACLSRALRGDRAVLAYNVRGYEPESHGLYARARAPSRLARWTLAWFSYRLPLHKICTTEWLRHKVRDPDAFVVGHGIDLRVFKSAKRRAHASPLVIGTIGRDGEAKGYPDFLRALERLGTDLPIRLMIAAPEPVKIPSRFAFEITSPATELAMARFYQRCDLFVFTSRGEGFGLPPLEAMASGCAVLTTDCGGVREYARPGQNCLMAPPAQPVAIARCLERLVGDSHFRAKLAESGVQTAQSWSREAVVERFCAYLVELTGDNRAPQRGPPADLTDLRR